MAETMPRSLNDPVGFMPSTLTCTSAPTAADRAGAGTSGVPPSPSVSRVSSCANGRCSRYSARTPRHWCAMWSFSFDAQDGIDAQHRGSGGEHIQRTVRAAADVRAERTGLRLLLLEQLLVDGRDGDPVAGQGAGDLGEHAGTVLHGERDVEGAAQLLERDRFELRVPRLPRAQPS